MKFRIYFSIIIAGLSLLNFSCSEQKKEQPAAKQGIKYTCPMHPEIIRDEPGSCPICHMDLVPVTKTESPVLMLSDSQIKLANIKTMTVGSGTFQNQMEIKGKIVTDANGIEIISARYNGRVDRLYVKEIGSPVQKGQKLYSIYSEELLALQTDYLLNLKQQDEFPNESIYKKLTEAAKHKLALYGWSETQIAQLKSRKKTDALLTVYAPISGIVKEINLIEGSYINTGMALFRIENSNNLWVEADVYPHELKNIKTGQTIQVLIPGFEDQAIASKLDFINPQYNDAQQIVTIRASIKNPDLNFQEGMLAKIIINKAAENEVLSIPVDAIVRHQNQKHVWVQTEKNTYEPRKIETDKENENFAIVKSGLNSGEQIVYSGAYLLYSEYKLKKGHLVL